MGGEAKDRFVVVIDAGHGGHDQGQLPIVLKRKIINLDIALKLGKKIQQNCSDTKVIYTRSKDVFVTLKGAYRDRQQSQGRLVYFYSHQFGR